MQTYKGIVQIKKVSEPIIKFHTTIDIIYVITTTLKLFHLLTTTPTHTYMHTDNSYSRIQKQTHVHLNGREKKTVRER